MADLADENISHAHSSATRRDFPLLRAGALDDRGQYGGSFCPCHGSIYDTSRRIRQGPAPLDLARPPYGFTTNATIKIG